MNDKKPEQHTELFVAHWGLPQGDATEVVVCSYCGRVLYSSAENIRAALDRGMKAACVSCVSGLLRKHGGAIGGMVANGKVLEK
jgi:ribosomal protein S27E